MDKIYCRLYDHHHLKKYKSYHYKSQAQNNYNKILEIANSMNYKYVSEALIDLHTTKLLIPAELSEIFGMCQMTITKHLKQMNCYKIHDFRFASEKYLLATNAGYNNVHECFIEHYKKNKSAQKTADLLQTTKRSVLVYLKKHNIKINPPGGANNFKKISNKHNKHNFEPEYTQLIKGE